MFFCAEKVTEFDDIGALNMETQGNLMAKTHGFSMGFRLRWSQLFRFLILILGRGRAAALATESMTKV